MIKNIKILKFFSTVAVLAAFLVPTNFSQAATFIADEAILKVGNYTQNPNSNNWQTSISANAGDIISFLIYYHNDSRDTARQTRVRLNLPSDKFSKGSITGNVWASNANQLNGSAYVNLNSSQILSYIPGSVRWYPACHTNQTKSLPNSQNGSEIVSNSGLNLGDVGAGSIGCVVVRVQVGNENQDDPSGSAPSVTTNSAYNINEDSAYLSGNVNPNNSDTDFWFEYGTTRSLGTTVGFHSVGSGNSSINETFKLYGLSPGTTYYFRAVARNSYGTTYGNILSFTTQWENNENYYEDAPRVYTESATSIEEDSATLNGSVDPNGSYTEAWFEYGTTRSLRYTTDHRSIGSFDYSRDYSIRVYNLSPDTTYYFRAVARNSYGTDYGNILTFTTYSSDDKNYYSYNYSYGQPLIITQSASPVYQNSALLNGSVNPNNGATTAWFQWGTTTNLGNTTSAQPVGAGNNYVNYSAALTGLSPNATYYFRAVASNSRGTVYGAILSFTTQASSPVVVSQPINYQPAQPQVIYVSTPVKTTTTNFSSSLILLVSNSDKGVAKVDEEINYNVVYKNISQQKLSDAVLKVTIPIETDFLGANPSAVSVDGNNIIYKIGDLGIGEQGTLNIKVKVNNRAKTNDTLIFAALLEYLDQNENFHSDSHFLAVTVSAGVSLMANLLSAINVGARFLWGLILGLIAGFLIYWFGIRKKFIKAE